MTEPGSKSQLEFVWKDESCFERELEERFGHPIEVILTDNASRVLTFRAASNGHLARLRIHRMFLSAPPNVMDALSTWLTKRRSKSSGDLVDTFIRDHQFMLRRSGTRRTRVETLGRHFDLQKIYNLVNEHEFNGKITSPITWGRMPHSRRRRSIRLGSFTPEDNIIRIHPLLDQEFVPEYFVRYIVYHEMLHAHLGVKKGASGRRCVHSLEFKRMEREYKDYKRAIAWHDDSKNLERLLRASPKLNGAHTD